MRLITKGCIYSGTSLNKPSKIKDTIAKTYNKDKIFVLTDVINTFLTSERGKLLYCSKIGKKCLVPKYP